MVTAANENETSSTKESLLYVDIETKTSQPHNEEEMFKHLRDFARGFDGLYVNPPAQPSFRAYESYQHMDGTDEYVLTRPSKEQVQATTGFLLNRGRTLPPVIYKPLPINREDVLNFFYNADGLPAKELETKFHARLLERGMTAEEIDLYYENQYRELAKRIGSDSESFSDPAPQPQPQPPPELIPRHEIVSRRRKYKRYNNKNE